MFAVSIVSSSSDVVICFTNEPMDAGVQKAFIGDGTCL